MTKIKILFGKYFVNNVTYMKNFFGGGAPAYQYCFFLVLVFLAFFVFFPNIIWLFVVDSPKKLLSEIFIPAFLVIVFLLSISRRLWVGVLLLMPWVML